jgi:hypothetical protein
VHVIGMQDGKLLSNQWGNEEKRQNSMSENRFMG